MDHTANSNPENVLRDWRTKILNGYLVVTAAAATVGTIVTAWDAISRPGQWPAVIVYSSLVVVLAILAFGRKIDIRIRSGGLLLVAYATSLSAFLNLGLGGSGRLYLIVLPIVALILLGVRSGILMSALSALTLLALTLLSRYSSLFQQMVVERSSLSSADWLAEDSDTLMLLAVAMVLLILFYRFQERLIEQEHQTQADLESAQGLLEEEKTNLEKKVEQRTQELQATYSDLEQRNAELTILNSLGEAMTKTLDVKTVTRIVGDKIRDIFDADAVSIMLLDSKRELIYSFYEFDKNEGGYLDNIEPLPMGVGLASKVISSRKTLLMNTLEEEIANGAYFPPELTEQGSGTLTQSWLGVPIMVSDKALGLVFLGDYQPNAFNEYHVRMFQTLSSNMGVAIENARLFSETQRLLKETEQRAAELAAVNTISSALSSELDLDVLIQLVGEQARSTFAADIVYVALLDDEKEMINFPYTYGEELTPIHFGEGITSKVIQANQAMLINQGFDQQMKDIGASIIGRESLSYLGVPINVVGGAVGVLSVQNTTNEGIFNDADARLLSTIASNVGTALHNAQLYAEAKKARIEAEAATHAKSAFLANMSHELRTPLNSIIGFTQIVRNKTEGILPEKQTENLDKVLISSGHLLNLINTVLDISKIEAGRMDVLPSNFRISAMIDLCYNTALPLLKPGVILEKNVDENLSFVFSDQDKIRQIVLNLLSNAAKFTHQGKILLSAYRDGETTLKITVADTGIGICPEALPRIFKEFQQADNSTTRQYGGTGLGLTISQNLTYLLGGEIAVESEPGRGSTFTLKIPIQYRGKT